MKLSMGLGLVVLVGFLVWGASRQGMAQPEGAGRELRKVTTTGTGSAVAVPDTARVVFAVTGVGRRVGGADPVKDAVKACDEASEKVTAAIGRLAIDGMSVKRGPLNLVSIRNEEGNVEFSRTVVVTLKGDGPDKLIRLADRVLVVALDAGAEAKPTFNTAGVNPFGVPNPALPTNERVELYCSDLSKARSEALKKALADALTNARTLAGTAQVTLRDIVTVTDPAATPLGIPGGTIPTPRGEVHGETEVTLSVLVTGVY